MRGVERSETALNLSAQRRANACNRKFGCSNHQFVRQSQHAIVLFAQPSVSLAILRLLVHVIVAWSIDLNNQSAFEANEIDNEIADRNLPAKFGPLAAPIPEVALKDRLRLNGLCTLLSGEAKENGFGKCRRASRDACASRQIPQGSKSFSLRSTPLISRRMRSIRPCHAPHDIFSRKGRRARVLRGRAVSSSQRGDHFRLANTARRFTAPFWKARRKAS